MYRTALYGFISPEYSSHILVKSRVFHGISKYRKQLSFYNVKIIKALIHTNLAVDFPQKVRRASHNNDNNITTQRDVRLEIQWRNQLPQSRETNDYLLKTDLIISHSKNYAEIFSFPPGKYFKLAYFLTIIFYNQKKFYSKKRSFFRKVSIVL